MADTFVVGNFAISTLQASITAGQTMLQMAVDDVSRFPVLNAGAKFALLLQDNDSGVLPEVVYVTNLTGGGTATVERAREGTTARAWLAGTFLNHTLTAGTISGLAGINPRGTWSALANYVPRDVVTYQQISYLAVNANLNSVPSSVSADWQTFYQPPGAVGNAMVYRGRWSSSTAYIIGETIEYNGRNYVAVANGTNNVPSPSSAFWAVLSAWGGGARATPVLSATGPNNYTVAVSPGSFGPNNLYDGLAFRVRFAAGNTGPITLALAGLAATPGRPASGIEFVSGDILTTELYEFTYLAGTNEFVTLAQAHISKRIADLEARMDTASRALIGAIVEWHSDTLPTWGVWANGQSLTTAAYPDLFAVFGYTHGGAGANFNVPDRRGVASYGKVTMGGTADNGKLAGSGLAGTAIATYGGAATGVLAQSNLPNISPTFTGIAGNGTVDSHSHDLPSTILVRDAPGTQGVGGASGLFLGQTGAFATSNFAPACHFTPSGTISSINGGVTQTAFSKLPPAIICNFVVVAKAIG